MFTGDDVAAILIGLWAVHPARVSPLGNDRYRRFPRGHVEIDNTGFQRYDTGVRRLLAHSASCSGRWAVTDVEGRATLVVTLRHARRSALHQGLIDSSYGYSGGAATAISAQSALRRELAVMTDGAARLYYLPLHLRPDEIVMALPSTGATTPRQRWIRIR
jgi:hypothetical protein